MLGVLDPSELQFPVEVVQELAVAPGQGGRVILAVGIVGLRACEGSSWIDSLFNASMIMSGMGPPQMPISAATKIFASIYAILSGLIFLTVSALLLAPVVHRFLHLFHARE